MCGSDHWNILASNSVGNDSKENAESAMICRRDRGLQLCA